MNHPWPVGRSLAVAALTVALVAIAPKAWAGSFVFAGEANGVDLIVHPQGYTGSQGLLTVEVCLDPQTLVPEGADLDDLATSIAIAIATWNASTPRLGNSLVGSASGVPSSALDFESVILHELGHCLGLAHVNAASESGLPAQDADYTRAAPGPNGVLDVAPGPDGIRGTHDDLRGDDVNLHWFRRDTNDPGALPLPNRIDATTYALDRAALPAGHAFAQNLDRNAAAAMGHPSSTTVRTEAVMQQGTLLGEAQRELSADDVATLSLAASGADETAGTADDYSVRLVYGGVSDAASCDLDVQFTAMNGLAFCALNGAYIDSPPGTTHARITSGYMEFGIDFNWHFDDGSSGCEPSAGDDTTCDGVDDDCDGAIDDDVPPAATGCGLGACSGNTGTLTCSGGTFVDSCDPVEGASTEACNGIDDDCDGATDEDLGSPPTTCGVGECAGNSGQETCSDGAWIDDCDPFEGAAPEACDGLDNDCDGVTDPGCSGALLEAGRITAGGAPVRVALANTYADPVVVTTVHYVANTIPVVARVGNVTSSGFDVRLQNPSGSPVAGDDVSWLVVERGSWTIDGVRIEARKYLSTVTSHRAAWNAEPQALQQAFDQPVVLGQVMSDNDPEWSVFFDHGEARTAPPGPAALATGKTVAGDTDTTRADEIVGFVVIEAGRGMLGGVEYEAGLGDDSVRGAVNGAPFVYGFGDPFAAAPTVVLATMAGVDGADGAWAQVHGTPAATTSQLFLSVDEDQIADAERSHVTEQVAYLALAGPLVYPAGPGCGSDPDCDDGAFCNGAESCDLATGSCSPGPAPCGGLSCDDVSDTCAAAEVPRMETVRVTAGATPTTVSLQHSYIRPVVACTAVYDANTVPVVVRLDRVGATSFEVRLQNPGDGSTVVADPVHCLVVEEGSWTVDGNAVDAWRVPATRTDHKASWVGEPRSLGQAFSRPVVVGQVMTSNDPEWSVYWQRGATRSSPPDGATLVNGKTVLEDPLVTRADEELGFIVFESGRGSIGGVAFEATLGADSVFGIDNGPPFDYPLTPPLPTAPEVVVATMAGVDGADGGWAYLYGPAFATPSTLALAIDEDQLAGAERSHTSEQVGYVAFAAALVHPDATCVADSDCDDDLFCNGHESCDLDTGRCLAGTPVTCDDGIACTVDACDEAGASCEAVPDDAACDDGSFCNGAETCDAALGCGPGPLPCAGGACDEGAATCPGMDPVARLEWGRVAAVTATPVRVDLGQPFVDPIVVTSVQYLHNTLPVVPRVTDVSATGFDVYLQNPSGDPIEGDDVHWLVVERGTWVVDGVSIEARRILSTRTAHDSGWNQFETLAYGQPFHSPVVLGQVMSVNDPDFSAFWSRGGSRGAPPSPTVLNVGKMVGEDPDIDRADEWLGIVIVEAGHGLIGGVEFEAGVTADFVAGATNSPPYVAPFAAPFGTVPGVALAIQTGMDGGNGGWMYTYGAAATTQTALSLASDEDQLSDSERSKATEQAAYCVFATSGSYP